MRIRPPQTSPARPACDRAADQVADREREPEGEHHPQQVGPVDQAEQAVVVDVPAVVAALLHAEVREEPADVRVDEAAQRAERAVAVADVRRVRIAGLVGHGVVLAVVGDPLGERALHRHAAEDGEGRLERRPGLEAAVREVAVEADRRSERAEDVEAGEQREVEPVEARRPRGVPSPRAARAAGPPPRRA